MSDREVQVEYKVFVRMNAELVEHALRVHLMQTIARSHSLPGLPGVLNDVFVLINVSNVGEVTGAELSYTVPVEKG